MGVAFFIVCVCVSGRVFAWLAVLSHLGALTAYLPTSAFTYCCRASRPDNTLFAAVKNPCNVGYDDMLKHMPLILAIYEISPRGTMLYIDIMLADTFVEKLYHAAVMP